MNLRLILISSLRCFLFSARQLKRMTTIVRHLALCLTLQVLYRSLPKRAQLIICLEADRIVENPGGVLELAIKSKLLVRHLLDFNVYHPLTFGAASSNVSENVGLLPSPP